MLVKSGEGMHEFGPDETANRCKMVAELNLAPGQCTGFHAHTDDLELFYMLEGELVYVEDGEEVVLKPGDCTSTCCGAKHQIINRSEEPARVLAIVIK